MLLKNSVTLFLNNYQNKSTRKSYYYILNPMQEFIGAARPIDQVTAVHLVEYHQYLKTLGNAQATVNKNVKGVQRFFNWCLSLDLITKSPATAIHSKRHTHKVDKDKAMSDDDYYTLLTYFRIARKTRDYALALFLGDTGCRAGGAANLKTQDIDLDKQIATITEKFGKTRLVAFGADCANAIRAWLLKRPTTAGDYIFSSRPTGMKSDNVGLIIRRGCVAAEIRQRSAHSLRHRKGHQMADAGIAASVAATVLGHSDPTTTLQHYYPNDWARAEEVLRQLSHQPQSNIIRLKKTVNN